MDNDRSSMFNSQIKRLSAQSKQAQSAKADIPDPQTVYKTKEPVVQAATETKNSSKTSAFQRLVMASKRMMQKRSSEKKDGGLRSRRTISG